MPSEVYGTELVSLRHRLEDAELKRKELLQEMEQTTDRQIFQHLLKNELPKTERLIERLTHEITNVRNQISYSIEEHLHKTDPTTFSPPRARPPAD